MCNLANNVNFLSDLSKTSIFITVLLSFCVIILIRKWLKGKTVVSPEGKAVLITGCDTGFGRQLSLSLNSLGYRVYATVLDVKSGDSLSEESENREQMVVHKMDVTDDEEVNDIYSKVKQDLEKNKCVLWSVVNNAGYGVLAQLEWVDLAQYKRLFEVNVFGTVRVTKAFLPLLRESKGRIVFVASILALEPLNSYGPYSMTKSSVRVFAQTLRRELNKFKIKVAVLYPGGCVTTNFIKSSFSAADQIWDQMDDSLKNSYGNHEYLESWKKRHQFSFDWLMTDKTDQVINDLIDAVTNSEPKKEYKPIGWLIGQILSDLMFLVPSSFMDFVDSY